MDKGEPKATLFELVYRINLEIEPV